MATTLLAVEGMNEVSFTLKDVIYISSLLITLVSAWFAIKAKTKENKDKLLGLEASNKENKEYFLKKLDSLKEETKENKEKFEKEIARVKYDNNETSKLIAKMDGKLDMILKQFKNN